MLSKKATAPPAGKTKTSLKDANADHSHRGIEIEFYMKTSL
jgi:hypothetical protein